MQDEPASPTDSHAEACDYWAFISYQHQDLGVARWLKRALGNEKIPPACRNLTKAGRKTFEDVFLDESSLSAGPSVNSGLERSLRRPAI